MVAPNADRPRLVPRVPLTTIDASVSGRLGTTRVSGNAQPAVFNRQVAMYLAKHVGGWSTTRIGKFYNGRDHSTVCYALKRIDALREADPEVDALLTSLAHEIRFAPVRQPNVRRNREPNLSIVRLVKRSETEFLDNLADRIAERLQRRGCQCSRFCARCGEAEMIAVEHTLGEATGAPAAGK